MDAISQIKQNLDVVDVIGGYVPLKKSGKNYKGVCPFHSEKTPSFMVSPELQIFKCFGCNEGGDMFRFVELMEGVDFPSALELLAEKAGVVLEKHDFDREGQLKKKIYHINETTAKFYHYLLLKHPAGKPGLSYVREKRGLTDETIRSFMIGYAPDKPTTLLDFMSKQGFSDDDLFQAGVVTERTYGNAGQLTDKFRGRVVFPLTGTDGKVEGFTGRTIFDREPKYLNTAETPVFYKSIYIYGLDKAKTTIKKEGAVFVEGQMDVLSAHQADFKNVIASSGTALTPGQLKIISRYTKDIIFCFDNDSAGIAAAKRASDLAEKLNFNIKVAMVPSGSKDLDELLKKDPSSVRELFSNAVSAYDFFLADALKRHDRTSALGKKGIMDELSAVFSRIASPVLLDHYVKKVSQELNLSQDTIYSVFVKKESYTSSETHVQESGEDPVQKIGPEPYLLAVFLHLALDTLEEFLYNLQPRDFEDLTVGKIVDKLANFVHKEKKLDITAFQKELPVELKETFDNLYLLDVSAEDDTHLKKLAQGAFGRVRTLSIKRNLAELSAKIKDAELSGNAKLTGQLMSDFSELSQELLKYKDF